MEKEISKEEFKKIFMEQASAQSGWTQEYWDEFYENKEGQKYLLTVPTDVNAKSMNIMSDYTGGKESHRIFFLTEDDVEDFYDFPGKE